MLTLHSIAQSSRTSIAPAPGLIARADKLSKETRGQIAVVMAQQGQEYVIAIIRFGRVTTFLARRVSQFRGDPNYSRNRQSLRVDEIQFRLDD